LLKSTTKSFANKTAKVGKTCKHKPTPGNEISLPNTTEDSAFDFNVGHLLYAWSLVVTYLLDTILTDGS
jgi:hypothetical protein